MSPTIILGLISALLGPLLSKLFERCQTPVSGQTTDPQAELQARRVGATGFTSETLRQSIPRFKAVAKRHNRGLHKDDPKRIDIKNTNWAAVVTKHYNDLLNLPKPVVMARYKSGCASVIGGEFDVDQ